MSIPIKFQKDINVQAEGKNWYNVGVLCDGSIYAIDDSYHMAPIDRTFAGLLFRLQIQEFRASLEDLKNRYVREIARYKRELAKLDSKRQYLLALPKSIEVCTKIEECLREIERVRYTRKEHLQNYKNGVRCAKKELTDMENFVKNKFHVKKTRVVDPEIAETKKIIAMKGKKK